MHPTKSQKANYRGQRVVICDDVYKSGPGRKDTIDGLREYLDDKCKTFGGAINGGHPAKSVDKLRRVRGTDNRGVPFILIIV